MQRLLLIQAGLVLLALPGAFYWYNINGLIAALYGGGIALINTLWLGRKVEAAGEMAEEDLTRGIYAIYFNAVQRFVFVLVALGVGLQALKLVPQPLLLTFGLAQIAYLFGKRNQY
jgi:ATP synthase protein I